MFCGLHNGENTCSPVPPMCLSVNFRLDAAHELKMFAPALH